MSKLSVVIPTWSGTKELADMAYHLCQIVKPQCDQLVVTEDSLIEWDHLKEIADVYLLHENVGYDENIRIGLQATTGDFVAVINSDIPVIKGDLRKLCIPGKVTSPRCEHLSYMTGFHAAFWAAPRSILEEIDYLHTKVIETAIVDRVNQGAFQWIETVTFEHLRTGTSMYAKRLLHEAKERGTEIEAHERLRDFFAERKRQEEHEHAAH